MSSHKAAVLQQHTLLIIDDDDMVRRSLAAYLEDSGYVSLEAENGVQGLELFLSSPPDLILCDLRLPDMSGLDIVRFVRDSGRPIPIIVVSGHGGLVDATEVLKSGAIDYLRKPIEDLRKLEDVIAMGLRIGVDENPPQADANTAHVGPVDNIRLKSAKELRATFAPLPAEQEAGLEVQRSLLPASSLKFGEFHCSHKIVPSYFISGDFIDYWGLSEDELLFYIADVSGHGLSSAFVTILLKYFARDNANKVNTTDNTGKVNTADYLSQLNNTFCDAGLDKHVTMIVGILNQRTHVLRYAVAGHYPSAVLTHNRHSLFLPGKGFPLGVTRKAAYQEQTTHLPQGFRLNLFSDGVLDLIAGSDLDAKENHLLALLDKHDGDQEKICQSLELESLQDVSDDVCYLNITHKN